MTYLQPLQRLTLSITVVFMVATAQAYDDKEKKGDCDNLRQFTFSWQFIDQCGMRPRGGTSTGGALTLDHTPHPGWLSLQLSLQGKGLSKKEQDRRAILAMAGPYRTSFDFLEVAGYTPDFKPDPPYQSWGTEYVYVVEDSEDFISLQHIMVMIYQDKEGKVSQPFVQKHWRQDWRYQKRDILVFAGQDTFTHEKFSRGEVKGTWAQSVYQVDDSPRYEAIGTWEHKPGFSTWLSSETWRPVPRREATFRKDYNVLIGTNRHTITPTGWVQEEENYKTVLNEDGEPTGDTPYLSKELGVNRYERLQNFDFSEGDKYWRLTGAYWEDVREAWEGIKKERHSFVLNETVNSTPLFMPFFQLAQQAYEAEDYNSAETKIKIAEILTRYIEKPAN